MQHIQLSSNAALVVTCTIGTQDLSVKRKQKGGIDCNLQKKSAEESHLGDQFVTGGWGMVGGWDREKKKSEHNKINKTAVYATVRLWNDPG